MPAEASAPCEKWCTESAENNNTTGVKPFGTALRLLISDFVFLRLKSYVTRRWLWA